MQKYIIIFYFQLLAILFYFGMQIKII
jgi:hypothetical protein